jgi:hypothetical protein
MTARITDPILDLRGLYFRFREALRSGDSGSDEPAGMRGLASQHNNALAYSVPAIYQIGPAPDHSAVDSESSGSYVPRGAEEITLPDDVDDYAVFAHGDDIYVQLTITDGTYTTTAVFNFTGEGAGGDNSFKLNSNLVGQSVLVYYSLKTGGTAEELYSLVVVPNEMASSDIP